MEGLLRLVAGDVHHLKVSEAVGEIHVGDSGAPGCVGGIQLIVGANFDTRTRRLSDFIIA